MGYLIYAITFFIIYYFAEQKILRGSLTKAARKLLDVYSSSNEISVFDLSTLRKKTDFYKLQNDKMIFKSFDPDKPDLSVSELDYKDLGRFKLIIENCRNNILCSHDFFVHKKDKHMIYPYSSENGSSDIILLSTYNNTINDVFNRNPRKG